MKKIIYTTILVWLVFSATSQNLLNIYKTGEVELIPDTEFAQNNNWDTIFKTYYDTLYNKPMGNRKSLIIMPGGEIAVNHAYRNFYSKFSSDGSFQYEFGITSPKGTQYKKTIQIAGIINNNTFFTGLNNIGNMICFDFKGNYKKTLKLNYMTRQLLPLPNGKIAVVGWVIWKTKFRDFVAIVDYQTNKQTIIWDHFTNQNVFEKGGHSNQLFHYTYAFKEHGGIQCSTVPFTRHTGMKARPRLACINNQLIMANPTSGEIIIFDLNGKQISKKQMDLKAGQVSVEEQKEIQRKAIEKYKKLDPLRFEKHLKTVSGDESKKAHNFLINAMKSDLNKIKEPIPKPFFSTMIKDSDDNLLFFDFAEKQNVNKFHVWIYKNGGKFICESSFVCKNYELQINPGKMVFYNGYIYGLQVLKKHPACHCV